MEPIYRLFFFVLLLNCFLSRTFAAESPYLQIRWLDLEVHQWKPEMLDKLEDEIDDELKYADERKGIECQSVEFEQEEGYPKEEDVRFLVTSVRGFCKDRSGNLYPIPKEIITVAMERQMDDINKAIGAKVFSVGNIQMYQRNRSILNFIIIPVSVGFVLLLCILTFVLRAIKQKQKRRHIENELEKQKGSSTKKPTTIPNPDPNANENQSLLQLDPNVVGNASNTLGSPKEFTNETKTNPLKNINRQSETNSTIVQTKDNRTPFDSKGSEMIAMQEQQPRVVVRTIRDDGNPTNYYSPHYPDSPAGRFVPIPVQIEHSSPDHRFAPPPYHSDPYYGHKNV